MSGVAGRMLAVLCAVGLFSLCAASCSCVSSGRGGASASASGGGAGHRGRASRVKGAAGGSAGRASKGSRPDPSRIYGDARLDAAYDAWADGGYVVPGGCGGHALEGRASWYGPGLQGNHTANGEIFDMYGMTAAHKTLPFNTIAVVTNTASGQSVVVRINDRGPYVPGRVIDMAYGPAYLIGMIGPGVVPVKIEVIEMGHGRYGEKW